MAFQPSNDSALLIASHASRPARITRLSAIRAAVARLSSAAASTSRSGSGSGGNDTGTGGPFHEGRSSHGDGGGILFSVQPDFYELSRNKTVIEAGCLLAAFVDDGFGSATEDGPRSCANVAQGKAAFGEANRQRRVLANLNPDMLIAGRRYDPAAVLSYKSVEYFPLLSAISPFFRAGVLGVGWIEPINVRRILYFLNECVGRARHGIRLKQPKSNAGRRDISLPDVLLEALRDYRKAQLELRMKLGAGKLPDDALLFADIDGNPPSPNALSAAWADFAERIGAPEISFHALRHTHASQLIDAGVDIVTISKRLGHASLTSPCASMRTCSAKTMPRRRRQLTRS
jgi:hypothetical protein